MKKNFLFTTHWKDLQLKLFYILGSYGLTFVICFQYKINLFYFISSYFILFKKTFIFTDLSSGFWSYFNLIFWISSLFITPLITYFFFFFFLKSLFNFQIKILLWSSGFFLLLFFYIIKIAFFKALPWALGFFINFENHTGPLLITLEARLDQYLIFFFNFLFFMVLLVLIPPLVVIFLVLTNKFHSKSNLRPYLYLGSLLVFLIFSPPDLIFQILFFSIFICIIELFLWIFQVFFFFLKIVKNTKK